MVSHNQLLGKEVRYQGGSEAPTTGGVLPACVSGQTCVDMRGGRSQSENPNTMKVKRPHGMITSSTRKGFPLRGVKVETEANSAHQMCVSEMHLTGRKNIL